MNNDGRKIEISVGASRRAKTWKKTSYTWQGLLKKLSSPTRTQETMAEYKAMAKAKRDDLKDVGGFVGGILKNGTRKADMVEARSLITLDLDHLPKGADIWPDVEVALDWAACMYSTHSHTEDNPRVRLILPADRLMTPDEYEAVARYVASLIGIDLCDDTTFEASRLMYWPSCSHDADYVFRHQSGDFLSVDEALATYDDWRDVSSWPVSSRKAKLDAARAKKQGDPTEKHGVVGAFCREYDIPAAIEHFLQDVYRPTSDPERYSYEGGSTVGGLVLYQNGAFAYSHHASDPIEGKLVNSFDLVRLHKFKDLDDGSDETKPQQLPSYKAMVEFALQDEAVSYRLAMERIDSAFDEQDEEEQEENWQKSLKITSKGMIANTINNIVLILLHDERLAGTFFFDSFRERPVVADDLPWIPFKNRVNDNWTDADDAGLRRFLEMYYQIESPSKIRDAVDLAMLSCVRHPVREYLDSLTWDGVPRVDSLFIDYLGAEDTQYVRAVTRASLVGAVARIMKPGCKHDHTLVLIGPQGCGKSTTLGKLGKQWYSDSLYTMSGKEAYEQLQGFWIIELGEMAAARKSEVEQIKQFISKRSDNYRAAYARRTEEHQRQCAFFGSTNDSDFLRDYTGGRRFWPVVVSDASENRAQSLTEETVNQVWAEALEMYKAGEKWYLSSDMEAQARRAQKAHTEVNGKQGLVEAFLEKKIPKDWDQRSLEERRLFWSDSFADEEPDEKKLETRTKVCAIEVWCECFNGEPKLYTQAQAREIGNILKMIDGWEYQTGLSMGKPYGRQRGFVRKESLLE